MLLALACPLIRLKQRLSGSLFYEDGCINFLQDFNSFLVVSTLPIEAKNTPYLIIVKQGTNLGNIIEARVQIDHIYELIVLLKLNNPLYAGISTDFEALNLLPDDKIYDNVFIYDDKNIDDEPNVASTNYFLWGYGIKYSNDSSPRIIKGCSQISNQ